jgi:hypothetical protein
MREALIADYQANQRKWLRQGKDGNPYIAGLSHPDDYFAGWRAAEITTDAIRAFIGKRQGEHGANGTINRELALLRRMFRLAVQDGKLKNGPALPDVGRGRGAQGLSRSRWLSKGPSGIARVSPAGPRDGLLYGDA